MKHSDHSDHDEIALQAASVVQLPELNLTTEKILDVAFKLHRMYGPGLLENAYQALMAYELAHHHGLKVDVQKPLPLVHEAITIDVAYRLDLLIDDTVIVELKACEKILPVHEAQLLTYMKLSGKPLGLLINFNARMLRDGIRRFKL